MGCDIHPHIEYRAVGEEHWYCFAEPTIGRDYDLFGLLAGVRGGPPLYQPRGRVRDPSMCVEIDDTLRVLDDKDYREQVGCCRMSEAKKWTSGEGIWHTRWVEGSDTTIYHVDHHSHSWLTLHELREVQDEYTAQMGSSNPILTGLIGAMAGLEYGDSLMAGATVAGSREQRSNHEKVRVHW